MKDMMNKKPRIFCGREPEWKTIPALVASCRKSKHRTVEKRIRRGIVEVICDIYGITYYK